MGKRKWNHVQIHEFHCYMVGRKFPKDGSWAVWKDNKGNIEIARLKYDAQIHFFPSPKKLDENIENLIAWRPLRKRRKADG